MSGHARSFMIIAGEASGDALAAELVTALRAAARSPLRFFGAGGSAMAAAGVDVAVDLTQHSMIGLVEAVKGYRRFRRIFDTLLAAAIAERPDALVCVDFGGFNLRFARAVRRAAAATRDWTPTIVQFVSPQVWASRPRRAQSMARDLDLLLTIFPFERAWYAAHAPGLTVQFVGHPMLDRFGAPGAATVTPADSITDATAHTPEVLLLPGSRVGEIRRHMPVMLGAVKDLRGEFPGAQVRIVTPNASLSALAHSAAAGMSGITIQTGNLPAALSSADVALASTGTVTMECAFFGVPTVALYRTSWFTYEIGRRIITVPYLAMPNILANEPIYPELIQHAATPAHLAREAAALLHDGPRRAAIRRRLAEVVASLGDPGASRRAAEAILATLEAGRLK